MYLVSLLFLGLRSVCEHTKHRRCVRVPCISVRGIGDGKCRSETCTVMNLFQHFRMCIPTRRSGLQSEIDAEEDGRPPLFLLLTGICVSNNCSQTFV